MTGQQELMDDAAAFVSKQLMVAPSGIAADRELKSLGLDSFRIIELVLFLERKTGLTFPEHAYTPANLKSIRSVVDAFLKIQR